tara:strand:- start:4736 stop:5059 length:324 start_codon:yes stop_codon:yes gene_type:complete
MEQIGSWAFIVGLILAIVFGFLPAAPWVVAVLVILGIVVGFLNITDKEIQPFLVGAIALIIAGNADLSSIPTVGGYLVSILNNFVVLMAPAAVVVAVKSVYGMAKNK